MMMKSLTRNGQELCIRPLRDTDADADRLLSFFAGLGPESRRLFRPHSFTREDAVRATKDTESGRSTRLVVVSPEEDRFVAYGYFSESGVTDARVPLLGIAVADSHQNQGLGRTLMQTLLEDARAQGKSGVQLTVFKENARAIHLYGALGFRIIGDADGGKQHAMRVDFAPSDATYDRRGVFLNPVPWGLTHLTMDTWTAEEWAGYLDFLAAGGANLAVLLVWPQQYHHPDVPETLPNAWRSGVLRGALDHARSLGMQTSLCLLPGGVPPSVWLAQPRARAVEVSYCGVGLCWRHGREEATRCASFAIDALATSLDSVSLWPTGPGFCACPECRDFGRVVRSMVEEYERILAGRLPLRLNLCGAAQVAARTGPRLHDDLAEALPAGPPPLVAPEDAELQAALRARGIPFLVLDPLLDSAGGADALSLMPRPRLRQVDRLVAQNTGVAGLVGHRAVPFSQFVTDYVLLQKQLFPSRADHEILRSLGSRLFPEAMPALSFARAVWALNAWWETGARHDLSDARDGLACLPRQVPPMVRTVRDAVELLWEMQEHLLHGERQFDALVTRLHAIMADSPSFQSYTVEQVWQTRARASVETCAAAWLSALREHLRRVGS